MNVVLKNGETGTMVENSGKQTVVVTVNGVDHLVCYVRNNVVKVKNDMILSDSDLSAARMMCEKFVKKTDTSSKKRR